MAMRAQIAFVVFVGACAGLLGLLVWLVLSDVRALVG
jgi:hypothetical protein